MKYVYLMTKNQGKIKAANNAFSKYGIELKSLDLEIPEIQADSSIEIAREAVKQAFDKTKKPVIREDHSFYINALKIPGPYMSFIEKRIDISTLLKILELFDDRTGYWEVATAFIDRVGKVHEFVFQVPIVFEREPKGSPESGWAQIIRFADETRVLTEYPEEERLHIWNQNYEKIAQLITNKN